jgi:hypothetical protein
MDGGMHIDKSFVHLENADFLQRTSLEPASNVTAERD